MRFEGPAAGAVHESAPRGSGGARASRGPLISSGSQKNPSRPRITEKVPQPADPGLHVELDIEAIKIQGQRKNALTLNFVDLFHRQWFPYYLIPYRLDFVSFLTNLA